MEYTVLSPIRKETSLCFCQNGVNFLRRLVLQGEEKKLDDSSRLDVVEIARVPDMLPSLFPSWSGKGLISTRIMHSKKCTSRKFR